MDLQDLIREYQHIDKYFARIHPHLSHQQKIFARLTKIMEELGELANEVHSEMGLQRKTKQIDYHRQDLENEWVDLFNTVMLFGVLMEIDIPQKITNRLADIKNRLEIEVNQ